MEVSGTLWVCLCVAEAAEGRMDGAAMFTGTTVQALQEA